MIFLDLSYRILAKPRQRRGESEIAARNGLLAPHDSGEDKGSNDFRIGQPRHVECRNRGLACGLQIKLGHYPFSTNGPFVSILVRQLGRSRESK
jgi:hypothetical protein